MSTRGHRRLVERGRHLASVREDLIAQGVDPNKLPVPLYPVAPPATNVDPYEAGHLRQLARAWWIATMGAVTAVIACISGTGAALVIHEALTWHAFLTAGAGIVWVGVGLGTAVYARRLGRRARAYTTGEPLP